MSLNTINVFRFALVWAIPIAVILFLITFLVTLYKTHTDSEYKLSVLVKVLFLILTSVIVFGVGFFCFTQIHTLKIDNEIKSKFDNVRVENIKIDMFEYSPYEEYNLKDRRVFLYDDEDKEIFCIIQPRNSYINQINDFPSFVHYVLLKLYSKSYKNEFGNIVVSPVYCELQHDLLIESYDGHIIIPISEQYDLVLVYSYSLSAREIKSEICSILDLICVS